MVPDSDPVKRPTDTETEGARVKRQVQQHTGEVVNSIPFLNTSTDDTGEVVNSIPFLNTSADVMDARAKAIQENARIAEIPIVETVANTSRDFDGLANALGEAAPQVVAPQEVTPHVVTPQEVAPQEFNIATPREKSRERNPRGR